MVESLLGGPERMLERLGGDCATLVLIPGGLLENVSYGAKIPLPACRDAEDA
jgi:hypothetical protein